MIFVHAEMTTMTATCRRCGSDLEFPVDLERIGCVSCGTHYDVLMLDGAVTLSPARSDAHSPGSPPEHEAEGQNGLVAAIDDAIQSLTASIEQLRSSEHGWPLEMGCALFSIFGLVMMVLAIFATVARRFFGGWLFYVVLIAVILGGLIRVRRKITTPWQRDELQRHRAELEAELARLQQERSRLLGSTPTTNTDAQV